MSMNVSTTNQTPLQRFIQKNVFYIAAVVDLIFFDYFSKFFVDTNLSGEKSITVIKDYFSISVSHNPSIAFSLPVSGKLVALFTPLLLAAIIYMIIKSCDTSKMLTKIAIVLVISGTVGNFFDRITKGYVVDFLAPSFFPSFNLADIYLTLGVAILIIGNRWIAKPQE